MQRFSWVRWMCGGMLFLLGSLGMARGGADPTEMDMARKRKVLEACFEVVVPKPKEDPLTYEKPLPWDQVPFQIRNDPYHSIGTAFAVSERELVTAFHVLDLHQRSDTYPRCYIRDREQRVFEVDQILACDQERDYVRFTVKDRTFATWLEVRDHYELNTVVYTAGNALGEGIVIRKGELIGTTPEPIAGAWSLLRSSADVNGGNSGGPLLDVQGRVLGVVVARKDNISMSLPMKEARPTGQARFFARMTYGFTLFQERSDPIDHTFTIPLPKNYADVKAEAHQTYLKHYREQMDALFERYRDKIFPTGSNSRSVFYDIPNSYRPEVVFKDANNGLWSFSELQSKAFEVSGDGKFYLSVADNTVFIRMKLPNALSQADAWEDPRKIMDLFLQGLRFTRSVGGEEVRVTSFGAPRRSFPHLDRYGRSWVFHVWALPHQDQFVIVPTLPVPGGFVMLLRQVETAALEPWIYDLTKLLDFTVVSYGGTLKDWRNFLNLTKAVPRFLQEMTLAFEPGKNLDVSTPWIQFRLDAKDWMIEPESSLVLYLGFQPWDQGARLVLRKLLYEGANNNYFSVLRYFRPEEGLPENYQKNWRDVVRGRHPYNNEAFSDEGSTVMATVLPSPDGNQPSEDKSSELHTLYVSLEGAVEPRIIKKRLTRLVERIRPLAVGGTGARPAVAAQP